MLEQIENKIEELKQLRSEEYYKKKDEDLRAWGLTTKVDGKKVTPIIVTDDEYEELVKASNGIGKVGRNSVAILLNVLSYAIVIIGVIAGAVIAQFTDGLGLVAFSVAVLAALIFAVIFRGIAEAIRLLQQIIDSKPLQRPEPLKTRKPEIKRSGKNQTAPVQSQQPAPYPPYPPQAQPYPPYGYPVYGAPQQGYQPPYPVQPVAQQPAQPVQPEAPADPLAAAYTPEALQAYYQNNQ